MRGDKTTGQQCLRPPATSKHLRHYFSTDSRSLVNPIASPDGIDIYCLLSSLSIPYRRQESSQSASTRHQLQTLGAPELHQTSDLDGRPPNRPTRPLLLCPLGKTEKVNSHPSRRVIQPPVCQSQRPVFAHQPAGQPENSTVRLLVLVQSEIS